MTASFLDQVLYLHSLGRWGEGEHFFLDLLDLDCLQLEIIHMTKRHFGVENFASLTVPSLILFVNPGQPLSNGLTDSNKTPVYFQAGFHSFKSPNSS